MTPKTAQQVEQEVLASGATYFQVRTCSICEAPVGYMIQVNQVYWDGNCDCTNYWYQPEPRSWQDLADYLNRSEA